MSLWCTVGCTKCHVEASEAAYQLSQSQAPPLLTSHDPALAKSSTNRERVDLTQVKIRNGKTVANEDTTGTALESLSQTSSSSHASVCGREKCTIEAKMDDFQLGAEHYELFMEIGTCYEDAGTIYLARYIPTGDLITVKQVNLDSCDLDITLIEHEVRMQRSQNHANLLPCLASFVVDQLLWVVLPLAEFGSCKDLLHAHFTEGIPELAIAHILREVLLALDYLHVKGIIHRAVRASHILVSASGQVFLTGFRHSFSMLEKGQRSKAVHDFPDNYVGCLLWASPELLKQNLGGYDTKSDTYSLGIVACELANGVVPFSDMPPTQMLLEKIEGTTPQLLDTVTIPELQSQEDTEPDEEAGEQHPYHRTFSAQFRNFVDQCLQAETSKRPSAATLLQHAFFKQIRRKSGTSTLPELLHPVAPISRDITAITKDENSVDSLTDKLDAIAMETDSWDFG